MSEETAIAVAAGQGTTTEDRLITLVLGGVTSVHSRRSYRTGLERFFGWIRSSGATPGFTNAPG